MMNIPSEVIADRRRIEAILALPAARNQIRAAVAVAVAGASVFEAATVLEITSNALSENSAPEGRR